MKPPEQSRVVAEFTHQAASFAVSPAMRAPAALDDFLALVPHGPGQRWCDVACGPGIVTRALAPCVAAVVGVDLTPAMLEKARSDAAQAGLANVSFVPGDATALPLPDGTFDGALTRFSLHHIPAPARVIAEMARIVRPGGIVAVADQVTSADGAAAAWHQEIERLRDPSHWSSLTWSALGAAGDRLGMTHVAERVGPFDLDWEEWLGRGSGGPANRALIEQLLAAPPPEAGEVFSVSGGTLQLRLGIMVWRRERPPGL